MQLKKLDATDYNTYEQPLLCRFIRSRFQDGADQCQWFAELEDSSGRAWLEIAAPAYPPTRFTKHTPVIVNLQPAFDRDEPDLRIWSLEAARIQTASQALSLTPRSQVPNLALPALDALQKFADELGADPLGGFLARLLLDPAIGSDLFTARGSWNHHHAYDGGLLVHTAEVMQLVGELARFKLAHQPRRIWQCQLAAFIHDLGKVQTHGPKNPNGLPLLQHEFVSAQLVAPHLAWLALRDPESANELSASLQHGGLPMTQRARCWSVVAELVALADQCSAMHLGEGVRRKLYSQPAANDAAESQTDTERDE